jgi:hypothetical protein
MQGSQTQTALRAAWDLKHKLEGHTMLYNEKLNILGFLSYKY